MRIWRGGVELEEYGTGWKGVEWRSETRGGL